MTQGDIVAKGFPRELDGHPLLAWMGDDWVEYVVMRMLEELQKQDAGTELEWVACDGEPQLETRAADGTVTHVELGVPMELRVRDGAAQAWQLRGVATFTPASTAFALESAERSVG